MNFSSFFDELVKLGAVDATQARASLDRLESMEKSKPTLGQVGRYAGIGAITGPAVSAIGDVIRGERPLAPASSMVGKPGGTARSIAARAAVGALTSGAIPLVRGYLDREAEKSKLRQFVQDWQREHVGQEQHTPDAKLGAAKPKEKDSQFVTSQYSGPLGPGGVTHLESYQGSAPIPSLRAPIVKSGAALIPKGGTPAARLALSKNVGQGVRATAPSFPSLAQQSKPFGFGHVIPGAAKGGL